jgi:hypothetical protein
VNHAVRLAGLSLLIVSLCAAEARLADVAVLAETRPTAIDWRWDDQLGSRHGAGTLDSAFAAGCGLRWGWGNAGRPHLLTTAADLLWERSQWDGAAIEGPMLRIGVGYAWAVTDRWLVQAGPELAYGVQHLSRSSAVSGDLRMQGPAVQAGLEAGVRWSLTPQWSLAVLGGWQSGRTHLSGDGADLTIDAAGLRCGLTFAYTCDARPRLLE